MNIMVIIAIAKMLEEFMAKFKQVPVLGDLLAGIILGPSLLGLVKPSESIEILANLGIISLIFLAGIETDITKLKKYSTAGIVTGLGGVIVSFFLGFIFGYFFNYGFHASLFIGAILVATSVGITVRTLMEIHAFETKEAYVILGAAVSDDIFGLIILAIVYAIAISKGGTFSELSQTMIMVVFSLLLILTAYYLTSKGIGKLNVIFKHLRTEEAHFIFMFIYGVVVALAVGFLKLSPIVGAFFIGLALSRMPAIHFFREKLTVVTALLAPIYFALAGLKLNIAEVHADYRHIIAVIVFVLLGLASKIIGCGLSAKPFGFTWLESLIIGVAMLPRAEVATIIAVTGISFQIIRQDVFLGTFLLIYTSSFMAPPLLKWLFSMKLKKQIS